jgi:competence ComEA-like helix-hairpin-helix protein
MLRRGVPLLLLLALALAPAAWRSRSHRAALPACTPEGRGAPPREWLGCAGDPGPPRDLSAAERLALGLPIDPNRAGEDALAQVPGLSRRLARAIVEHRDAHGPFADLEGLRAVKGIGPRRLEQARARLAVGAGEIAAPPFHR